MIKYLFDRFKNSLKNNGFLKTFLKIPSKFFIIIKLASMDKRKKDIYALFDKYLSVIPSEIVMLKNYAVDLEIFRGDNLSVISGGIHDDLGFELEIHKIGGKVYCFDPTDTSKNMFESDQSLSKIFSYFDKAIWTYDGQIKFYYDSLHNSEFVSDGSIHNIESSKFSKSIDCLTIPTICKNNNIEKLDFLKLDIEGAAPEVLISLFENNENEKFWPLQFCVELEFPKDRYSKLFDNTYILIEKLFELIKPKYKVYLVPRDNEFSHLIIYGKMIT